MANPLPLVGLPGHDIGLTAAWVGNTVDADYPATNLNLGDPAKVVKSTGNTLTLTGTTASSSVVVAAVINTNATTVTVNSVSLTVPSLDSDGQRKHGWLDRRETPLGPTTTWTIALSRASGVVWTGPIVLLTAVWELNLRYGLQLGRLRPSDTVIRTRGGSLIKHGFQIRTRTARGVITDVDSQSLLESLEASAKGQILPFLFIPDEAVNDAWLVSFDEANFSVGYPDYDVRDMGFQVTELSGGPPNG